MCGIQLKSFSTRNPFEVDCKRCFMAYSGAVDWYWHHLNQQPVPAGARWLNIDMPIPGLHLIALRSQLV